MSNCRGSARRRPRRWPPTGSTFRRSPPSRPRSKCPRSIVADGRDCRRPVAGGGKRRTHGGFAGVAGIGRHGPARRRLHRAGRRRAARHGSARRRRVRDSPRSRRRGGCRRPRDAAGARRHDRPAGERGRRGGDRPFPRRRRTSLAEVQPARTHRQRHPAARAGPRNRDPGRIADPVADVARRRGRGLRPAGVRPLHAVPGTDALARRGRQRRVDGPAVAAQEPRRRGCGAAGAGADVARGAAAAVLDPDRPVRQPFGAAVPDPAAGGAGTRQARQSRDPGRPDRARSLGAGKARRPARAPAAQRAGPRCRAARRARARRQDRDRRDNAYRSPGRQ